MKKFAFVVLLLCFVCLLTGCDEGVKNDSQSSIISTEENKNTENYANIESSSMGNNVSGMPNDISSQNNGEPYYPTLEELNANAYDAAKMGPKKLVRDVDYKVDIVVGDDYFATQLSDMFVDFNKYEGKVIEIEGFAMKEGPYTFVGRYSENAICPTCPVGFAYYEFEWHGDEKIDLGEQKNWIKVIGKLTRGNDGNEYYYIDAYEVDVMDHWGEVSRVTN